MSRTLAPPPTPSLPEDGQWFAIAVESIRGETAGTRRQDLYTL